MQTTFALAALAVVALAAPAPAPVPQGVTENLAPEAPAPAGCSPTYSGEFQITATNNTFAKRASTCGSDGSLTLNLNNGVLLDSQGRTGSIVANYQFQFDKPAQAGAIYTAGWSTCSNGSLALGGSAVFYQCLSGDFYNLYDRHWAEQCSPVLLEILPCSGSAPLPSNGVGAQPDGQPTGTAVGTAVTQIGDGQIQAPTGVPLSELPDGQPQVPTAVVSQIGDGQIQAPTAVPTEAPVTQIGDGQIQAPTAAATPVTQIGDGQIQAPTGAPVSQISDGQIQAPTATGAPITQIGDGQIQAPTGAPVTQIGDGQIQAPVTSGVAAPTGAPVTQIGDGQIQAPANATSTPVPFTGAGNSLTVASSFGAIVVGVMALCL